MFTRKENGPIEVTLPNGRRLNRSDLPPKTTKRWVARHKAVVVEAVSHGLLTMDEACSNYGLSREELDSWIVLARSHGAGALKATALQRYR